MIRRLISMRFCRNRRRRSAFTLAELIVALAISAIVAAAVMSMLFATARATETRTDVRHSVIHANQLEARLRHCILSSCAFLGKDTTHLVLWLSDDNDDDVVNLGELGLIEYDAGNTQLRFYEVVWPAGWNQAKIDAANVAYTAGENFLQRALNAQGAVYFPQRVWSNQVSALTITLDDATPLDAKLATLRLTVASGDIPHPLIVAAGLRTPKSVTGG